MKNRSYTDWPHGEKHKTGLVQRTTGHLMHAVRYTDLMRIPHTKLSPAALRAVVEEFVTRDGTDHSMVQHRIEQVLFQLDAGRVMLHFDNETQSCNILPAAEGENPLTLE